MATIIQRYFKRAKKGIAKAVPDYSRKVPPELKVFEEKAAEEKETEVEELTRKVDVEEVKLKKLVEAGPTQKEKQKRIKSAIKAQKENVKIMRNVVKQAKAACEIDVKTAKSEYIASMQLLRNLKQQKKSVL